MRIFKYTTRETWHIVDESSERYKYSYCKNANLKEYDGEPVKNLESVVEVRGNSLPKLCKACVQHAYENGVLEIRVKENAE